MGAAPKRNRENLGDGLILETRDDGTRRIYLRFTDLDGSRRMKKAPGEGLSRSEHIKAAKKWAHALRTNVANGKVGINEPTAEQLEALRAGKEAERARLAFTVDQLADRFLAEYRPAKVQNLNGYRVQTGSIYRANLRKPLGARPVVDLRRAEVTRVRDAILAGGKSQGTAVAALRVLSKMFEWGRVAEVIDCPNPVKGVERGSVEPSLDYFDAAEVGRLLAHVEQHAGELAPGLHPMVATAVYAGLRKGELFGLRWRDLDLEARRLTVARSYTKVPKSGKVRHLPVNPELVPLLRAWRDACPQTPDGLVFPIRDERSRVRGWRMGRTDTMHDLEAVLGAAGCHAPAKPWHALRHTFASHFMMAGGNILTLQKLLGHQKLEMTLIYAHLAPDFMAAEVARMSYPRPTAAGVADLAEARRRRELAASDERSAEG